MNSEKTLSEVVTHVLDSYGVGNYFMQSEMYEPTSETLERVSQKYYGRQEDVGLAEWAAKCLSDEVEVEIGDDSLKAVIEFFLSGVTFECADHHGGEGQGDDYYSVYRFVRGEEECYVQFQGSYTSYCGSEYDDWFFVTPRETTITVYDRVMG